MSKALTVASIRAFKPRAGLRPEIPDAGAPGLYLIVHSTGRKTWVFRYRRPNGKPAKLTLGTVDVLREESEARLGGHFGLTGARRLTNELRRQVAQGLDPALALAAERERKQAEAAGTFDSAARLFIRRDQKPKNRRWRETARMLGLRVDRQTDELEDEPAKSGLVARWGERPVTQIKKGDVIHVIDEIVDRGSPQMANLTFRMLRRLFNFLVERDMLDRSPCAGLKEPSATVPRDRILTDDEVFAFWRACGRLGQPFGPMYRLLLISGQRLNEIAGMTRSELQGDTWVLPAARTKNKREHVLPLPVRAQEIIGEMGSNTELVFTTTGKSAASGFSKAKKRLDARMLRTLRALARLRGDDPRKVTLPAWRLHDLRRTAASNMARVGVSLPVIEKTLNHVSGTFAGVAGVYQRHNFQEEMRHGLEAWCHLLQTLVGPTPTDEIVPLRRVPVARGALDHTAV